jgi:hypothetical protein
VYEEYRRIGYRLKPIASESDENQMNLFEDNNGNSFTS